MAALISPLDPESVIRTGAKGVPARYGAKSVCAMNLEDVEIVTGDLSRPYKVLGPIRARVVAETLFHKRPTFEAVKFKLRDVALRKGANAIINVTYRRGISPFSWKALTAYRVAVVVEATDRKCPYCAEMIKREARVCRFCGRDVEPERGVAS